MDILQLKDGIVAGMLLGDGFLSNQNKALRLEHTLKQFNYLKFKMDILSRLGFNCRVYSKTTKRTNLGLYDYCSGAANGSNIKQIYHKSLADLLAVLNPLGLLIWWLDDGCLIVHQKKNGSISRFGYLNTQAFNLEENQEIGRALYQKFGIETTIHVDSKSGFAKQDHHRLYLNATNMRRLIDLVREFIPSIPNDMRYKLNMQYVVNQRKNSLEMATHYNF